ncbi:MAG: hypothetical protein ABIW76_12945 [Fibrobacteria bacterium]
MLCYRNRPWFQFLSALVLAVFLQAQAAGCCKIGAWFHATPKPHSTSGTAAAVSTVSANDNGHSCCPKPSAEDGFGIADASGSRVFAGSMERTCCLQDADLNAAELVSMHDGSSSHLATPTFPRLLETLFPPRSEAFAASAFLDPDPPASRSALPLLI